jgi:RNA polymerase sigma-70 factor (ECF subfamily)
MIHAEEEAGLIRRIREGETEAFERLFKLHCRALVRFALRFVGQNETAEGIVQDVFVRIWRGRAQLNPDLSVKAYLYQAVKNQSLQHLRHLKIVHQKQELREQAPSNRSPEAAVERQETARAVYEAISELPPHRRMIFTLSKYDHYTYAEIAEIQKISIKTVETQMGRALKFLRKRLAHLLGFLSFFLSGYLSSMG